MCGRTACTLAPDEIGKACSVRTINKDGKKQYQAAQWRDHPGSHTYVPSYNVAPSRYTPVIVSEHHFRGVKRSNEDENLPVQRVIQPMMWGLIPSFYKGDSATGHGLKTNNCRIEDVEEKKSYKPCLVRGQRCVVLCDGFYEWQTTKGDKNKQPYFIYPQQPDGVEIWNRKTWDNPDVWSEEEGWKGPPLLKMAAIFSRWTSTEGEEVMSYSVITMESGKSFAGIHHRIPAILETEQDVEDWLDSGRIGYKEALANMKNEVSMSWHPVDPAVNNSRNQELNMNVPADLNKKPPETASSKLMSAWLSKAPKKEVNSSAVKKEPLSTNSQKVEKPSPLAKWLKKEEGGSTDETQVKKKESGSQDDMQVKKVEGGSNDKTQVKKEESGSNDETQVKKEESGSNDETQVKKEESGSNYETQVKKEESGSNDETQGKKKESGSNDETQVKKKESGSNDETQGKKEESGSNDETQGKKEESGSTDDMQS